ncbi:MAG: hypothetical protein ACREQC_03215, partial [Candidatus Binataceae bacterium]
MYTTAVLAPTRSANLAILAQSAIRSLAYTPDKGNTVGSHKIQLTVPNQKDLIIQARDGYYYGQYSS